MESHILHVFTIVMLYMLNSTGVKYLLTNGISLWFESTEKLTLRNTVVMDISMYTPNSSVNLIWNQYSFGWLFWNNRLSYFSELKEIGTPCEGMWPSSLQPPDDLIVHTPERFLTIISSRQKHKFNYSKSKIIAFRKKFHANSKFIDDYKIEKVGTCTKLTTNFLTLLYWAVHLN